MENFNNFKLLMTAEEKMYEAINALVNVKDVPETKKIMDQIFKTKEIILKQIAKAAGK